jgi:colicin import membrane protein
MSVHSVEDLVPLRTGFDLSWRGYHREEVDDYVHDLEHDLHDLAADRDACTARAEHLDRLLAEARAENRALRAELNRVCSSPLDPAVLPVRLAVMVEVATAEAESITAQARAAWAASQSAAARLREHYDDLAAEVLRQRDENEAEHQAIVREAWAKARLIVAETEARQQESDMASAKARAQVEEDFKLAMDLRRAEALRALAEG